MGHTKMHKDKKDYTNPRTILQNTDKTKNVMDINHIDDKKGNSKNKKEHARENLRARNKLSKKNKHRARLIVRNLPFAVTEENLRQHFEQYGQIDEVELLKKEDGQLLGCGFVQFNLVQMAAKAKYHLNGKPFLNRGIECDWALPKDKYKVIVDEVKIKEEPTDDGYNLKEIKTEETETDIQQNNSTTEEDEDMKEDDTKVEDDSDVSAEDAEDTDEEPEHLDAKPATLKPKVESHDTVEGKTVFIKNVPFTAINTDIKECLSQFGPLYYALVCMDPLTEHSKGTAFVKFRNKDDADKCLQATNVTLMGHILELKAALGRDELKKSGEKSSEKHKDSRNLYLVKEGVILAGSKAAEAVSASDMAKRLQLEQYKTQMLRNLNMIVARTRLVVHNIPPSWDDHKLRTLFQKYSSPKSVIREAKIMRNMRIIDAKGMGKSKEFGFVSYTTHEAALDVLRTINNNPNVFSANKRPIVAFSIENRAKLLTKDKRLHNSRIKNPKCKNYDPKSIRGKPTTGTTVQSIPEDVERSKFAGVAATPGIKKMRNRFNLKTQAKVHHEQLKKEKKDKKFAKKTLEQKRAEFTKQPKQKINKNKNRETDNFSKLVSQYKKQLFGSSENEGKKKKKWFS